MSEPPPTTPGPAADWPQPPPPPARQDASSPALPPAPPPFAPPPAPGPPGAGWAGTGWSGGAAAGWYAPLVPPRRAEGRTAFLALTVGASMTAWTLFLVAAAFTGQMASLPATIAGTAALLRDSQVLVTLAVILAAATAASLWAGRAWLRHVAAATGASSTGALLGGIEHPAFGTSRPVPAARGLARSIVLLPIAGLVLVVIGLAMWLAVVEPRVTRSGLVLVLAGAAAYAVAQGLLPAFLRAIERREHLAAPPDAYGRRVALPAERHPIGGVLLALGGLSLVLVTALAVGPVRVEDVTCAAPDDWSCGTVSVPAIPGDTGPRPDVVSVGYAIRRAPSPTPEDRQVLLIAVGGPGSSGIEEAEWYGDSLPSEIVSRYDIVLFDARGVGSTDLRECPDAFERYATDDSPAGAKEFAEACVSEAGAAGLDLRRYGTSAVVEDVEAIRAALGIDEMAVYGASYGTVVAQAYAVAHPDRVSALVLDAPLDRQLDGVEVWQTAADGFGDVLAETFQACTEDGTCASELRDAPAAWRRLVSRVDGDGRLSARMPDDRGRVGLHEVSRDDLYLAIRAALYEETGRMLVLRGLAAADAGDDRLLVRLAESSGDGSYWPGAFSYYAAWCADTRVSPTARADDLDAFQAAARDRHSGAPGADSVIRTLMPCLYWPGQPPLGAVPADPSGVPTLILTATSDPITPDTEARRILAGIEGARLVEMRGGGHVSFGTGSDCVDDAVVGLLVDGRQPTARVTTCQGWVADTYVALTPYGSRPVDAPWSVAVELLNDPAYVYWQGDGELVIPCLEAGRARVTDRRFEPDGVVLEGCTMASGTPPIDGSGTLDWYSASAELDVTLPGGSIEFRLDPDGPHATGTWNGEPYSYGR